MKLIPPLLFLISLGLGQAPAQEADAARLRRELYVDCTSQMRTRIHDAYIQCREYLKRFPDDEARRVDYVKKWLEAYDKVQPYIRYAARAMIAPPGEDWFIHDPDTAIEIPAVSQAEGAHRIEIERTFKDRREESMLRKAEAVYPSAEKIIVKVMMDPVYWSEHLTATGEPLWWEGNNANVRRAGVVTAAAVRYYYDLSRGLEKDPGFVAGFRMENTGLKYSARLEHRDEYERGGKLFRNVYVADLNLEWSQVCGGLCGAGFKRNKVVVFDPSGNVMALFLDAPENSGWWVS